MTLQIPLSEEVTEPTPKPNRDGCQIDDLKQCPPNKQW